MGLGAIELVPHPESEVEPLKLEELLSSVKDTLSFEVVYSGKYVRLYLVGPGEVLRNLRKSLKTIYGKVIVEEASPPSLKSLLTTSGCLEYNEKRKAYRLRKGCSWFVAELRLSRPIYYVLVSHSEKKPLETNPIDVVLASMKPGTYVQIIFHPEPGGRSVIANWVGSKLYGTSTSVPKEMLRVIFSDSVTYDYRYRYEYYRHLMLDTERDQLRQAQLKMASPLFAVRIRVYADSKDKVHEVASSFNQFSGNSFKFRIREVKDEDIVISEERRPLRLGWLFKDKRMPILSARELALFVNLPTPSSSLPLRTGYVSLEPPPNLPTLGFGRGELSVEELRGLVSNDVIPLGMHGDKLVGMPLDEFRRTHKAIFGTTGAGKSSFARYLMLSVLLSYGCGRVGIVYFDLNGDDAVKLIKLLPEECVDNLVYVDPLTLDYVGRVVRFNLIEYRDERDREYIIESFIGALRAIYRDSWGQRLERILRMALKLVTSAPPGTYSLVDVYRVLVDEEVRAKFLEYAYEDEVIKFFTSELPQLIKKVPEALNSVLNKLDPIINNKILRPFVEAKRSSVDLARVLDEGGIVVINMAALKKVPHVLTVFGTMMLSQIASIAYSRGRRSEASRTPIFVFIDEAHNFVESSTARIIAQMMAETRKFGVYLVVMTQYPQQLPKGLRAALYELAGNVFTFQVGLESARELRKLYEPYLTDHDLINMDPYNFAARVKFRAKVLRPFTLKAPYIPVSIDGNPYTEDRVSSERIARSLQRYGTAVSGSRAGIEIKYGPRTYVATYTLYKCGSELSLVEAVKELMSSGLAKDFFEATDLLKDLSSRGLVVVSEDKVVLTNEALKLFSFEFPETKHSGSEWHRSVIKELAEELLSKRNYVWVDTTGSTESPDIIAVPASQDLSEWLYDRATCYEVESDPMKHTTFDKLVQILRRCYRAGCSKVIIVVLDEGGKGVVESRLREVMAKAGNVSVAMSIPKEWLSEVEIEVEALAKESKAEVKEVVTEEGDLADRFLNWVKDRALDLVAVGAFIVDKDAYLLTAEAARRFSKDLGAKVSLKELARILSSKYPGVEYKGVWREGKTIWVLKIPKDILRTK